jgi:hypothetical protein
MPLRVTEPPAGVAAAVQSALRQRAERGHFRTAALARSRRSQFALTAPHEVYGLTLQNLAGGRGLEAASLLGWRYLIQSGERAIAAAELPSGAAVESLVLNEGPFVGATVEAITTAERLQQLEQASYALRLLKIPALYVIALWLRRDDGAEDLIIPIGQTDPAVESGRVYSGKDFTDALRNAAREQLEFDTSPRG